MEHEPASVRLAAWQFGVSIMLILGAVVVAGTANGQVSTIGRTWPIAEPDALAEIEARAARQPANISEKFGRRQHWSAMRSATLGEAKSDRRRTVVPFHMLEFDVRLPDGTLLYPKGFTFNPLAYVSLPHRLVVVHPADLDWALAQARPSDWILLAGGQPGSADPVTLGEQAGRPLFILEEGVKERLGLSVAPVIIAQIGQKLELQEFFIDSRRPDSGK